MKEYYASEHSEQVALFDWAFYNARKYPELRLMFAIPNGGLRNIITAKKLKAEGVKAGVPDIFLPVPRGVYHGLFIEMKSHNGHPTHIQQGWITELKRQGYHAIVCYGWEHAKQTIINYLKEVKNGSKTDGSNTGD